MKKIISLLIIAVMAASVTVSALTIDLQADEISVSGWAFDASSVNANNGVPLEIPQNVTDGSLSSHWHSMINPKAEPPHYLTVILPSVTEVGGYRYYPRESASGTKAGTCTKYEIYVSSDGENYEKAASGTWENNASAKTVRFKNNYKAKYVRLQILEATGGYGSAAEIRILKPDAAKKTVSVTGKLRFENAASESGESVGQGELSTEGWTFEASSVNANNGVPAEVPERTVDGDLKSHWHTMINPKAELPHYITAILPSVQYVSGYRYYPRTDGVKAGICTKYEIYVSDDLKNYVLAASGTWPSTTAAKTADFGANINAKAVKLVITEAEGGYGSAGEIRLIGIKDNYKNMTVEQYREKNEQLILKPVLFASMKVHATGNSAHPVSNMADGYSDTYWHTEMVAGKLPQDISYNFRYPYTIEGMRYIPRQDGNLTGHFLKFDVLISDDGREYSLLKSFETASSENYKDFMFDGPVKTKYLKIHLKEGLYGYGTCADMYFLQRGEQFIEDEANCEEAYILSVGSNSVKVKKDGQEKNLTFDTAPFIYEGSTMIPLRGLMEEMGMSVEWDGAVQKINVFDDGTDMELFIEDDRVYINSERYNSAAPPMIRDSRTFIPLRFMSEQMGYNVYWDGEKQEIKISTK